MNNYEEQTRGTSQISPSKGEIIPKTTISRYLATSIWSEPVADLPPRLMTNKERKTAHKEINIASD